MTECVVRGTIVGTDRVSDVIVEDGTVVAVRRAGRRRADYGSKGAIIAPPLFDIQVNGGGGINLQRPKLTVDDVAALDGWLAGQGVGLWVPTIMTASLGGMERNCRVIAEALGARRIARRIPGIHLEGPFISRVDGPRGAHPKRHVRKPSIREFDRLLKAADGKVMYTTVAPEVPGAIAFIRAVVKRGVVVSLGHHHGSAESIARAVDAGATMCTHLGNGLAPMIDRHDNPIWPQLADTRLTPSLIADGHHLPPPMIETIIRAKGPGHVILTSDCVHLAGMKAGTYELAGQAVELTRRGRINLVGTTLLAGSATPLLHGVANAMGVAGLSLEQAFATATTVPARALGLGRRFDGPMPGRKAEFVVFELVAGARGTKVKRLKTLH
jgi:N-acetylglucosamine-6-phosphate deacetylase